METAIWISCLKKSDNGLYYRLQEIDKGRNSLGFSATARLIRGVTDFNASVGIIESYGPEVNAAVVKLGITWDNSKTTTEAYYADVNGDGLIDFIDNRGKDSKIFINKLDDNGLPVFSNKAEADTIWVTGDCGPEPIYNMGEVDETIYDPEEMWGDVETDSCYTKCVVPALPCCSICTVLGAGHPDCANYHTCGQRCNANCGGCESFNLPDLGLSSALGLLTPDATNKEEEQVPVKKKIKKKPKRGFRQS